MIFSTFNWVYRWFKGETITVARTARTLTATGTTTRTVSAIPTANSGSATKTFTCSPTPKTIRCASSSKISKATKGEKNTMFLSLGQYLKRKKKSLALFLFHRPNPITFSLPLSLFNLLCENGALYRERRSSQHFFMQAIAPGRLMRKLSLDCVTVPKYDSARRRRRCFFFFSFATKMDRAGAKRKRRKWREKGRWSRWDNTHGYGRRTGWLNTAQFHWRPVDKPGDDNQLVKMLIHSSPSRGSPLLVFLRQKNKIYIGTPSIPASNCTRNESSTSWRLAATRATPETRSTILGTDPTWAPSPPTTGNYPFLRCFSTTVYRKPILTQDRFRIKLWYSNSTCL